MSAPTPWEDPNAYNAITIDGERTPGLCTFKGGGDRQSKIETMQSIGFQGAYTVHRGEEVPTIDYEIHVWTSEDYKAGQVLAEKLEAARKRRPPQVLTLVDLALDHNKISRVEVKRVGAWERRSVGRWFFGFTLSAYQKPKPIGGVPRGPKTDLEREIEAANAENAVLDARLKAAELAASRGI